MRMSALRDDMTLLIAPESLAFGTFVVDESHRVVSWNAAAQRTLGYGAEATLGRTCEEMLTLLHAEQAPVCPDVTDTVVASDRSDASCPVGSPIDPHALRQHEGEPMELQVVALNGATRWLSLSVMRGRTLAGSACVLHIFRDITEQAERHGQSVSAGQAARQPGAILHLPLGTAITDFESQEMALAPEHLTPREHEVLELLARGMATVEIATRLGISRVTARNHVTRVIEKLGVKTRLQAVLAASHLGLI
jgi:DNA-binding CsgD family transcriptional regulator